MAKKPAAKREVNLQQVLAALDGIEQQLRDIRIALGDTVTAQGLPARPCAPPPATPCLAPNPGKPCSVPDPGTPCLAPLPGTPCASPDPGRPCSTVQR